MIRSGRLPAWDPLIWSGTPLLAGWNAGALFPGTLLFSFLPLGLAWTANFVAPLALCGVGTHLLLRRHGVGPLAAVLGALLFTYTGFMSGQVVHLGLETGTALLPFVLLAINCLAGQPSPRARVGFVALLGCALAGTILAGDPRALTSTAIVAIPYALVLSWRPLGALLRALVPMALGALLGGLLGAIQWLPGLTFLSNSQRSSAAYSFFGTGSVDAFRLATQLLVPFFLGGNGNLALPVYAGNYNLPELSIGSGLVALAAALLYLFPLAASLRARVLGLPHAADGRHLGLWYLIGALGVLLALGTTIPLGHLTVHLPLFGGERLQNRSAVLFDLALAVLAAYLVEDLGTPDSEVRRLLLGRRRVVVLLPALGSIGLAALAIADPGRLAAHFRLPRLLATLHGMRPYFVATIIFAVLSAGALLVAARRGTRAARLIVGAAVFADALLYGLNASYPAVPESSLAAHTPLSQGLARYTGPTGRFALYNPSFAIPAEGPVAVNELGVTDLNILHDVASVEGYGSLVSGAYQQVTATHFFENVSRSLLSSSEADTLDLRSLVALPLSFSITLPIGSPIPLSVAPGVATNAAGAPAAPAYFAGPWSVGAGAPATFVFASPTVLRRASVTLLPAKVRPAALTVAAVGPSGAVTRRTAAVERDGTVRVNLGGVSAVELVVSDTGPAAEIGATVAVTAAPSERLLLDGALQGSLAAPRWRYGGQLGPFSVWQNTETHGLAWLEPQRSTAADPALATPGEVTVQDAALGATQRTTVDAPRAALLVRSENYSGGWTARLRPLAGGPTRVIAVQRLGLVQAVPIPKGRWVVTWRYAPASLLLGLIVTICGLVTLLAMCGWLLRRRKG
ncbi:MAG TPA: hypothetical protein VNF07_06015 [Acidimicrobiales bacterium]|nr:hypothetical protein [Acidimicrobiales bacterium]